jgi:transposase-like protein
MSTKDKGGRPTKYRAEFCEQAREMIRWGGFSQAKLARIFGVGKGTVTDWMKAHPEFERAIQEGQDLYTVKEAERCLVKLVKGFRYREKKYERDSVVDDNGKIVGWEMVLTEERTKQVPPNVKAITTYLQSRAPERWPNVKNIELTGANGGPVRSEYKIEFVDADDGSETGEIADTE